MSDRQLPRPVTVSDHFLAAMLDELKAINAQLIQPEPVAGNEVDLKEPAYVLTPLPDGFPGKDALEEDGYIYLESGPKTGAELVQIPGIGKATANKILTWMKTA